MPSLESQRIRAALLANPEPSDVPLDVERREWEAAAAQVALPSGITITPVDLAGRHGEWVSSPQASPQHVLYYMHGGGYTSGSCVTHRELAARLCLASGVRVLLLDYRLAPEHPFPAAIEDAGAGYHWLLDHGIAPERIVFGGDSAGGGLAVAALLWLRERAVALPAAAVLLSPWLDMTVSGPSVQDRAAVAPVSSREDLLRAAGRYLGGTDPRNPLASPIYADLHGLPPLLIQAGDHELLLSDSTHLARQAQAAGVEVTLEIWDEMWHVWHAWAGGLPEGQQAINGIGAFIRRKLAY